MNSAGRPVVDAVMSAAFPSECTAWVIEAAGSPHPPGDLGDTALIQDTFRHRWGDVLVQEETVEILDRHQQRGRRGAALDPGARSVLMSWLTRSLDGYLRHAALRELLRDIRPWTAPFIVQLCGEYVPQIGQEILTLAEGQLAASPSSRAMFAEFWHNNPQFIDLTHQRAASYQLHCGTWCLPSGAGYPQIEALRRIEQLIT